MAPNSVDVAVSSESDDDTDVSIVSIPPVSVVKSPTVMESDDTSMHTVEFEGPDVDRPIVVGLFASSASSDGGAVITMPEVDVRTPSHGIRLESSSESDESDSFKLDQITLKPPAAGSNISVLVGLDDTMTQVTTDYRPRPSVVRPRPVPSGDSDGTTEPIDSSLLPTDASQITEEHLSKLTLEQRLMLYGSTWAVIIQRVSTGTVIGYGTLVISDENSAPEKSTDTVIAAADIFLNTQSRQYELQDDLIVIVGLGTRMEKRMYISSIQVHKDVVGGRSLSGSVAIIKLQHRVEFNTYVSGIKLADKYGYPIPTDKCYTTSYHSNKREFTPYAVAVSISKQETEKILGTETAAYGVAVITTAVNDKEMLGGSLICLVHGSAYLYGIHTSDVKYGHEFNGKYVSYYQLVNTKIVHEKITSQHTSHEWISMYSSHRHVTSVSYNYFKTIKFNPVAVMNKKQFGLTKAQMSAMVAMLELGKSGQLLIKPSKDGSASQEKHNHITVEQPGATSKIPAIPVVHIMDISTSPPQILCTGTLYVPNNASSSNIIITSASCVWSKYTPKYRVYIGPMNGEYVRLEDVKDSLIPIRKVYNEEKIAELNRLQMMGGAVVKTKVPISINPGVRPLEPVSPVVYLAKHFTCYTIGMCSHGLPTAVKVDLLDDSECKSRISIFESDTEYCGLMPKNILQTPLGAPLICEIDDRWYQFGFYDADTDKPASVRHLIPKREEDNYQIGLFRKVRMNIDQYSGVEESSLWESKVATDSFGYRN